MSDAANRPGLCGENIVFIVGSPRSGTTWLQRLLATHPQIKTGQESRIFEYVGAHGRLWRQDAASAKTGSRSGTGLACHLNEAAFLAAEKKFIETALGQMLKELQPGEIFLEKTPAHAKCLPDIQQFLPAAKIIHLLRDPRDVVASLLAASRGWGRAWAPTKARNAARIWREHVSRAQADGVALAAGQFLEVSYETLFENPSAALQTIAVFLNLNWPVAVIEQAVAANAADELRQGRGTPIPQRGEHEKNSGGQVRDPDGFVRKARAGSWREDLTWLEVWQVRQALRGCAAAERYFGK
jgi:hypothetical protein